MAVIEIPIERLGDLYEGMAKQIPFAVAGALNDTAFDARREIQTDILPTNLTLRNKFTQRSIAVNKASKTNLVAEVGSLSWYVGRLVTGGNTRARRGIMHKGKRYLFIPVRRTKGGKVPRSRGGGEPFVIEAGGGTLLLVKRTSPKRLVTLGFLVDETTHDKEIPWEKDVEKVIREQFPRRFAQRMERAIKTAR